MVPGGAVKLIVVGFEDVLGGKLTGWAKLAVSREVGSPSELTFHSERCTGSPCASSY